MGNASHFRHLGRGRVERPSFTLFILPLDAEPFALQLPDSSYDEED